MMNRTSYRGFTIIELLVVVSIIALLVGILLPAIGKAREQAQMTQSQGNMKNLGAAAQTYSAEYNDRQLTYCADNLSTYGTQAGSVTGYLAQVGVNHPSIFTGTAETGVTYAYAMPGEPGYPQASAGGNYVAAIPADYQSTQRFGGFRILQSRNFTTYLGRKFFHPVFYAPKDTAVLSSVEQLMESPSEFHSQGNDATQNPLWGSYCFSPAGMINPDVLSRNAAGAYYTNPWTLAAGFRSPSMGQATYADLKTHIIEHHWLQNRRKICGPFVGGAYNGCQPYMYNGSRESAPVTLYYDGHIGNRGQRDAIESNQRVVTQSGQAGESHGLWSINTQWAGGYTPDSNNGYYMDACIDNTSTSYHMLTIDGIKGRDFLSK